MIQHLASPASSPASSPAFAVREVCAVLSVSSSGYYAQRYKGERPRRREDKVLTQAVQQAFEESQATYGSPRLVRVLRQRGLRTSKTRVRRLMQSAKLCPHQKRRLRVRTTRSNPHLPVAPHRLLDAPPVQGPGERFHSDITSIPTQEGWTSIPTQEGWLFLAATLDGYSRRCAGWSAAANMEAPLVLRAAQRALAGASTQERVHLHSDRGSGAPFGSCQ